MRKVGTVDATGRKRVQTVNTDPSMTVQSDAHLADIQNILKSYGAEGQQQLDEAALEFKDVSGFTDFADLMNMTKTAEVEFMKLPSKVREVFNHDVMDWLDTAHDKDKRDALVALGVLEAAEPPEVVEAVVEPPTVTTEPEPKPDPGGV